ncbi:thiamine pyrophosphate-requiring protein [Pusillimonas sp.]|uniref:thiamine pyrophosphate-requiring protein n=1 Tax=Pusillimonas sp. TaxID=3040095 RepID=UPI0037CC6CFD
MVSTAPNSVAYRFLTGLSERGVRHIFANAGTDFAPLIEAELLGRQHNAAMPRFINVPHEHTAVTVAHGAHLVDGQPQVVGVHHTVGTANTLSAVMTAARERIPLLLFAGRTPSTEQGHIGSRDVVVHWGTDTFDQAGMLREYTKWDHELREGQNIEDILDRALDIALSEPCGPVYLTLPREVLSGNPAFKAIPGRRRTGSHGAAPDHDAIEHVTDWLLESDHPVIVTSSAGRDPSIPEILAQFAEQAAVPVVEHYPRAVNLSSKHPFHAGFDPSGLVAEADLVIVLDCEVPWIPRTVAPHAHARIVHIGVDPLYARIPVRSFPVDSSITGRPAAALRMMAESLRRKCNIDTSSMARRREQAQSEAIHRADSNPAATCPAPDDRIDAAELSASLGRLIDNDMIVLNEYGLQLESLGLTKAGTFFSAGISGALGWTVAAAIGVQMAALDKTVIAVVGDGSYIFGNPVSCHYLAQAEQLPIITIVVNNAGYAAVSRAVESVYPNGLAAKTSDIPLASFHPQPSYEGVASACGAYAERVETRQQLHDSLTHAIQIARRERRQVLLNVICNPTS